jgi:hypothetical protein
MAPRRRLATALERSGASERDNTLMALPVTAMSWCTRNDYEDRDE